MNPKAFAIRRAQEFGYEVTSLSLWLAPEQLSGKLPPTPGFRLAKNGTMLQMRSLALQRWAQNQNDENRLQELNLKHVAIQLI